LKYYISDWYLNSREVVYRSENPGRVAELLNYITEQFRYVVIHVAEADNPKAALRAAN